MILDIGVSERPRGDINLDVARTKYCNPVASAEYLPIISNSIDKVLCSQVLEHLTNPFLALKEIDRVLKVNGKAEIDVPKPSLTNKAKYHLLELLLNFPSIFMPSYIKRLVTSLKGLKNRDPRWCHRYVITVDFVKRFLAVNSSREIGDLFLKPLTSGRKAKYFKKKPKINTKILLRCSKK